MGLLSSFSLDGSAGRLLAAQLGRADDGCPGNGVAADGEAEIGGTRCFVEARLVDVQGGHGEVVGVRTRACWGCAADVLVGAAVARELEGVLRELGPVR